MLIILVVLMWKIPEDATGAIAGTFIGSLAMENLTISDNSSKNIY